MDFALVEVIDIDVVVVIRFVAMEIIPEERLAQEKAAAKRRLMKKAERDLKRPDEGHLSFTQDQLRVETVSRKFL